MSDASDGRAFRRRAAGTPLRGSVGEMRDLLAGTVREAGVDLAVDAATETASELFG